MPELLTVASPVGGSRRRAPGARRRAARRETLVFRLAMAAAALWVLDDAFWHREPGTAVGDHLASGLVPAALAVLLALAYPRLRPGARAVAALAAGPLMLVAGVVDGVRHVAVDRLGGDDVTAILAGVGGRGAARPRRGRAVALAAARRASAAPLPAARARRRRRADGGRLRRAAGRVRDRGQPQGARAGGASRPRPAVHRRDADDERRAAARRLVRPLAQRRGGDRLPRPQGPSPPRAHARAPRLRRPAARPPRRGRERGRLQRARLGRRAGPARGGRLPARAPRRPRRPHRRPRPVGRRRDAAADRRARRPACAPWCPRAPACARSPSRSTCPARPRSRSAGSRRSRPRRPPASSSPTTCRRPTSPTSCRGSHRDPSCSSAGCRATRDEALNRVYRDAGGPTVTLWEIPRAGHTAGISAAPAEYEHTVIGFFDRALRPGAGT